MTVPKEVPAEVEASIRRLVARYCHLVDDGDVDAAAELFGDDARFIYLGEELKGRDAIRDMLSDQSAGPRLHQVTNVVVSNGSHDGTFHAVSDVSVVAKRGDGWSAVFAGRYHDTFAGAGRGMRFTQRILTGR